MSMMPISQSYHVLTAATRYVVYAICNNHPLTNGTLSQDYDATQRFYFYQHCPTDINPYRNAKILIQSLHQCTTNCQECTTNLLLLIGSNLVSN
eukprot:920575_1